MGDQIAVPSVVMIRHAQSSWNREGRFTGWADPPLTALGRAEAQRAGEALAAHAFRFDLAYASRLTRARETAETVLRLVGDAKVPLLTDWRLNERHYGALQGQDKSAMAERVGKAQVRRWRRAYLERPPAIGADQPGHPSRDPQWADIPAEQLPDGESLADTRERVIAFWDERMVPQLRNGSRLLVASHGNTLRALIMALHGMSVDEVEAFEIPTGVPIVYAFTPQGKPIGWHYLHDSDSQAA